MGRKWCQIEPVIKVSGQTFYVTARAFTENARLATAGFQVSVPTSALTAVVDKIPNQKIADDYTGVDFTRREDNDPRVVISFSGSGNPGDENCITELIVNTAHSAHQVAQGRITERLVLEFVLHDE